MRPDLVVRLGEHPDRRPLVDVEALDLLCDPGDELDGGGAGADDRHALAAQVVVVVPPAGVDRLARELVDPGDVGRLRLGQGAQRGDQEAGRHDLFADPRQPDVVLLVELDAVDFDAQPEVLAQSVLLDAVLGVALDLVALGEDARPARIQLERELVAERRDVDGDPRIGVVPPGAADVVGLLEDHEVVDPLVLRA